MNIERSTSKEEQKTLPWAGKFYYYCFGLTAISRLPREQAPRVAGDKSTKALGN